MQLAYKPQSYITWYCILPMIANASNGHWDDMHKAHNCTAKVFDTIVV